MSECPCEKCISYAICLQVNKVGPLVHRCSLLAKYVVGVREAVEAIKTLKPGYYRDNKQLYKQYPVTSMEAMQNVITIINDAKFEREAKKL